ncbi:NAD-dependent epimerase/dehydratase family protein [Micromonospora sp. LZ34]
MLVIPTDPWRYDPSTGAEESLIAEVLDALAAEVAGSATQTEKAKNLWFAFASALTGPRRSSWRRVPPAVTPRSSADRGMCGHPCAWPVAIPGTGSAGRGRLPVLRPSRGLTDSRVLRGRFGVRILVVGGSGLIGAHVADVLRERGHAVTALARTAQLGVDHLLDLGSASIDELRPLLAGHDGLVYAARTDEQRPLRKPIYPVFRRDMVEPVVRLMTAARHEGLTRGVIMASYYTYFDRLHPQWRLAARHTYIRCRVEQAREGRVAAGPDLPVAVLELPFVFGRAGDRLPNWAGPLDRWARSRSPLAVPAGGTAATSARSVAEVAVDSLEQARGEDIPVADENLTWNDMIARIAEAVGRRRPVGHLPASAVRASLRLGGMLQALGRIESGINPSHLADLLLAKLYIEPATGRSLDPALRETFADPAAAA